MVYFILYFQQIICGGTYIIEHLVKKLFTFRGVSYMIIKRTVGRKDTTNIRNCQGVIYLTQDMYQAVLTLSALHNTSFSKEVSNIVEDYVKKHMDEINSYGGNSDE